MNDVKKTVLATLQTVADQISLPIDNIEDHDLLIEGLGFKSLDIATLVSYLEMELDIDPFSSNQANITDIRTVADICQVYEKCLSSDIKDEHETLAMNDVIKRAEARRMGIKRRS